MKPPDKPTGGKPKSPYFQTRPSQFIGGNGGSHTQKGRSPDKPASEPQIFRLLTMLSKYEIINSWWEDDQRVFDKKNAIRWVREELGFLIRSLEDLTMEQVGQCYTAIDPSEEGK